MEHTHPESCLQDTHYCIAVYRTRLTLTYILAGGLAPILAALSPWQELSTNVSPAPYTILGSAPRKLQQVVHQ